LFVERTVATFHFKAEGHVAVLVYKILKVIFLAVIIRSVEIM